MIQEQLLTELQELEVSLHQPAVRRSVTELDRLLHPRFREFGRSGRSYTKGDVLADLPEEEESFVVWSQEFEVEPLVEGWALLTYKSAHVGVQGELTRHTNRSSIWQHTARGWQMLFHQGTPCEPFEPVQPSSSIERTATGK